MLTPVYIEVWGSQMKTDQMCGIDNSHTVANETHLLVSGKFKKW